MIFFSFFFSLFFLIIQSQEAFVNCLYVARFTIVHSKAQIKFPLLLYIIEKVINIAIRATVHFLFRNRSWDSRSLDLIRFTSIRYYSKRLEAIGWNSGLNNSISNSICKLPIRSETYNCTFKNTNKVSIIVLHSSLSLPRFIARWINNYKTLLNVLWATFSVVLALRKASFWPVVRSFAKPPPNT